MPYMLVRHKVADFARWRRVFDSHGPAQARAGLKVAHLMRNVEDPNEVFVLMEIEDFDCARAFVSAPDVPAAQDESGVVDVPDLYFLR
jgi:hypothetical protein